MKTISTKYLGPTDFKGSRVRATDGDSSVILNWQSELSSDANHARAARELARKNGWKGTLIQGNTKTGCVFVFASGQHVEI